MTGSNAAIQLAPPPRVLPDSMAVRMLIGSVRSQIGWLVIGFGSIFFWGFAWQGDYSGWRFNPHQARRTYGTVMFCRQTHMSEGGSKGRGGTPIYENRYSYSVSSQPFEGSSYAVGLCRAGATVEVQYLQQEPGFSRIVGMRRQPLSPWAAMVALLPGTGVLMVLSGFLRGRTHLRLLREGLPATARLVSKNRTYAQTNGSSVYRLTFEYTPQSGGPRRTTIRDNRPSAFEGKGENLLLYDPADPGCAALLASMPGAIAAGARGQPATRASSAFLILPAIAVLGNVLYVCSHWLSRL